MNYEKIFQNIIRNVRGNSKSVIPDTIAYGTKILRETIEEATVITPWDYYLYAPSPTSKPEKEERGHERTKFISGPETVPSKAKRAELRAKRKKRK